MLAGNVLTFWKTNKTKTSATHAGSCCLALCLLQRLYIQISLENLNKGQQRCHVLISGL